MRSVLPVIVAFLWLAVTVKLVAPFETIGDVLRAAVGGELRGRWPDWVFLLWIVAMVAAMVVADRLYCVWRRRRMPDPRSVHWTRLRNREGHFVCAHCSSIFMLPPEDFDPDKMVACGDCGAPKARYGDMKPYLDPAGRMAETVRRIVFRR